MSVKVCTAALSVFPVPTGEHGVIKLSTFLRTHFLGAHKALARAAHVNLRHSGKAATGERDFDRPKASAFNKLMGQ
jgi:hypothetical protein